MIRIEEVLDQLFRYERKSTELSRKLVAANYATESSDHINIRVKNEYYGLEGVIPMSGVFSPKRGMELVYFTSEPDLTYDGELLPEPFHHYKDCSKMHVGLIMNCLAYLSPVRFDRMTAITKESLMINVDYKPQIAEQFILYASGLKKTEAQSKEEKKLTRKGVYVNRNQVSMFS